ncbi:hypothetical protein [Amycolatopsis balhimycina]|uniref:hypothetical protein n=1 Tax=Amycolatopsis balhimycina TaxID=208443 RepID=UPI00037C42CF|nr:hypothetical protein [Amycolatopsis balhimycina]
MDGSVDLIDGEAAATRRHAVPTEDGAHRPPVDAEPGTQLIHRRSSLVADDEFLNVVGVESACLPWLEAVDGQRSRLGGVWQLPEQGLQGF